MVDTEPSPTTDTLEAEREPLVSGTAPSSDQIGAASTSPPSDIKPDKNYFLEADPMAIFRVEDTLFRVHRYFLIKNSPVFETMFTCPPGDDGPEGCTEERPIVLPGVLAKEFSDLLDCFYKPETARPGQVSERELSRQLGRLSISTRFEFSEIRNEAIAWLTNWKDYVDPVERILLADKYAISQWLVPAYRDICQRVEPLEEHEAVRLGFRQTVLLARTREVIRCEVPKAPDFKALGLFFPSTVAKSRKKNKPPKRFVSETPQYEVGGVTSVIEKIFNLTSETGERALE